MELNRREMLAAGVSMGVGLGLAGTATGAAAQEEGGFGGQVGANSGWQPSTVDMNYKPRRINKAIELWEDDQPVYYIGHGIRPGDNPYEVGKKMAKTYADCINYGLEHGPLDFTAFSEYMRGLKDGGPTRSGHATPAVFVEPPITGHDEAYARSNAWIISNLLDLGAHGVHICHARDEKAMEVIAQMGCRFTFDYPNTPKVALQGQGLRGQPPGDAPSKWGVSSGKYMHIADVWPLNPKGEIMVGAKIEDHFADANMAKVLAVQGLAFAEWGPTDNTQSVLGLAAYDENAPVTAGRGPGGGGARRTPEQDKILQDIRAKVLAECKKNKLQFLNSASPDPSNESYVIAQIKDGARLMGGNSEAITKLGREFTKRKMPV